MDPLSAKARRESAIQDVTNNLKTRTSDRILEWEAASSAHNYSPVPVVFSKCSGVAVVNPEGKKFFDFLSGYGSVSHGHIHPRILEVAIEQMKKCTLSSRAFHSDVFGTYASFITKYFGYESVLPMNTGAEGVETALKIARCWGYKVKKIPANKAIIVCCTGNFHGRTFGAIALSEDPSSFENFGPHLPGIDRVKYGDIEELKAKFEKDGSNICCFIAEPIQGEAGVMIPPPGYFKGVRELCDKHNIIMICDEVQSGVGRSGKMLAIEHEEVRPDMVILAKALGAGFMPVSCVLSDWKFMDVITPGTHGSTFGGNPLACAVAIESLRVMHEEELPEKSAVQGKKLLDGLVALSNKFEIIKSVRGRGLFAAIDFDTDALEGNAAKKYMHILADMGVLAKYTHGHTLRLSPPLVISDDELAECLAIMDKACVKLTELWKK
eukprot:Tbor_TRINITY_DN5027_c0_g2::TRINITY_DN5027_c0_g2_i1::g.14033::m.14033/K00819/rocD, OAT; ornithine--oxo-acid transaminase